MYQETEKKTLIKEKKAPKTEKKSKNNNKHFFTFTFLYTKKFCILSVLMIHLYYSFFAWQVIGNAVMKHQGS